MLAIVILNWNGEKLLGEFLPSVIEFSQNHQIYVIDNASTDNSVSFLKSNFPEIQIIQHTENYGFTKGYNLGLQEIKAEFYCLLNSDVKVTKNWINPILELFKKDNSIAAIQPKILSYSQPEYFEFAGAAGGLIDSFGYPYCRGRIFDTLEKDLGQFNDEVEIFWATGACFFIRKNDFDEMNGFDEDFFAHMEEIDLCWRLKNQDKKVFYCGKSTVFHLGGGTLNKVSPKKTYLNFRNNLLMLLKNLPKNTWILIIFIRMILDGIAAFKFLFSNGISHVFAILKAHIYFYLNFFKFYKKRKAGKKKYFNSKSILWDFYMKK